MSQHRSFDDVTDFIDGQRGVLDGEAFRNHERVIEKPNPEGHGFDFTCTCNNCARQSVVTVPWPELIVASCGAPPLDTESRRPWIVQQGCMYPPVGCGACGRPLSVPITPDKAARFLKTGVSSGKLNEQYVVQAQQETLRRLGSLRR